ncbi:hypothetical protein, partial [Peribacillus simplex]|uniref:hypothetical protein n=1 Tax=Peribacillus simplex TaxID=1478 RepID=UPI001C881FBF
NKAWSTINNLKSALSLQTSRSLQIIFFFTCKNVSSFLRKLWSGTWIAVFLPSNKPILFQYG